MLEPLFLYKHTGPYTYIREIMPLLKERNIEVEMNNLKSECDILHVNDIYPYSFLMKKITKASLVTTTHATPSIMKGTTPEFLDVFWKFYLKHFYNLFDKVITISPNSTKEIEKIGIKNEKIECLMHGINLKKFKPDEKKRKKLREKLGIERNEKVIFNASRIEPRKGIFEFIKIASFFPECKFFWFGIFPTILTPNYNKISSIIKNPPKNVIFIGRMNDITTAYNAGDIFFFPSLGESFGLSIIEAAACGKPVLLKKISDFDIFNFPLKYNSQKDCIEKIEMLLNSKYYNRYKNLSIKGVKDFDIKKHIQGLIEIYETLV